MCLENLKNILIVIGELDICTAYLKFSDLPLTRGMRDKFHGNIF